jgi:predicted alpha/beta-hydrolase family hydrolase
MMLPAGGTISGLLDAPESSLACYAMAHGAGAGMKHVFLAAIAGALAERGIAVLRYQFPYMEQGSRRPDAPAIAHAAVRAAVQEAVNRLPGVPLFAGGKSFGGRMTSQAQAAEPLPSVRGLVFLGFPLHPAGKPSVERAAHLTAVKLPMLFLQGTRDTLADLDLMRQTTAALGPRATLYTAEGADHSFHVPRRSGGNDDQVRQALVDTMAKWMIAGR